MILDSGFLLKTLWFYPSYLGISIQFFVLIVEFYPFSMVENQTWVSLRYSWYLLHLKGKMKRMS